MLLSGSIPEDIPEKDPDVWSRDLVYNYFIKHENS